MEYLNLETTMVFVVLLSAKVVVDIIGYSLNLLQGHKNAKRFNNWERDFKKWEIQQENEIFALTKDTQKALDDCSSSVALLTKNTQEAFDRLVRTIEELKQDTIETFDEQEGNISSLRADTKKAVGELTDYLDEVSAKITINWNKLDSMDRKPVLAKKKAVKK